VPEKKRVKEILDSYWERRYFNNPEAKSLALEAVAACDADTPGEDRAWSDFAALASEINEGAAEWQIERMDALRERFAALGEEDGRVAAIAQMAVIYTNVGRPADGVRLLDAIQGASPVDKRVAYMIETLRVMTYTEAGESLKAMKASYEGLDIARRLASPARIALSLANLATGHALYGNWDEAVSSCREALDMAERFGLSNRRRTAPATLAISLIATGRAEEARPLMDEWAAGFLDNPLDMYIFYGTYVYAYVLALNPDSLPKAKGIIAAAAEKVEGLPADFRESLSTVELYKAWAEGAVARRDGRLEDAVRALRSAERYYDLCLSGFVRVDARRELYLALRGLGRLDEALDTHEEYVRRLEELLSACNRDKLQTLAIRHLLEKERALRIEAETEASMRRQLFRGLAEELALAARGLAGVAGVEREFAAISSALKAIKACAEASWYPARAPFSADAALRLAAERLGPIARAHSVEVAVVNDEHIPTVLYGDEDAVVDCLCACALRAMAEGKGRLVMEASHAGAQPSSAKIRFEARIEPAEGQAASETKAGLGDADPTGFIEMEAARGLARTMGASIRESNASYSLELWLPIA
jgi:tetratricopeptide (TPR) repeat protein